MDNHGEYPVCEGVSGGAVWVTARHLKTQMKSSACSACSEVCMEHTHHMPAPGARDLARHQGPSCGQIGQSAPAIQRESLSHPALQTCASAGERLPTVPAIQRPCVFSSYPPATIEADKGAVFCSGRVPCAHCCAPLWFCLHYHEESMGQWDASNVQAGVCEL